MSKYIKTNIPKSLKQAVWLKHVGQKFEGKCYISWCQNKITPFSFEVGHNIPESKGGSTTIDNLRPLCAQCNKSMGNRFTIDEFNKNHSPKQRGWGCSCFSPIVDDEEHY